VNPYLSRHHLDVDLAELDAWNAAIRRSRQEYRINPTAACGVTDCDRLRIYGAMCKHHTYGGKK
jgi:hypothetical protein